MRLSRRSEYGLRALIDLVRHQDEGPVPLATLAERERLPPKFLEQIMATLKHAGLVRTTLGAHGGYTLAPGAPDASLSHVIRLLDGALAPVGCTSLLFYEPCSCPDEATCSLREAMIEVRDRMLADGMISPADLELLHLTDDPDIAVQRVLESYDPPK